MFDPKGQNGEKEGEEKYLGSSWDLRGETQSVIFWAEKKSWLTSRDI